VGKIFPRPHFMSRGRGQKGEERKEGILID